MRLFIAIRFSKPILETLVRAQQSLARQGARGNFTRQENLHLTLAFLGETEDAEAALAAMRQVCGGGPFSLTVSGAGRFGDLWWAGVEKNPRLTALARSLESALRSRGFSLERRAFRPHVTLVRQLTAPRPVDLRIFPKSMVVREISLMESERVRGILTYTEVGRCPLTEPPEE